VLLLLAVSRVLPAVLVATDAPGFQSPVLQWKRPGVMAAGHRGMIMMSGRGTIGRSPALPLHMSRSNNERHGKDREKIVVANCLPFAGAAACSKAPVMEALAVSRCLAREHQMMIASHQLLIACLTI
jgi:hypothetical protein